MTTRQVRREDFDLGSGFADDIDGVVVDAWFGPAGEEYVARSGDSDTPFLHLKLDGEDLDKPIEQTWSTGEARKWQVEREGSEVVSAKSPDKHSFMGNSRAGDLVNRLLLLAGEGDREKGVGVFLERGYLMTEAEFYKGVSAHWEQVEMDTVGGEKRKVLMPVAFYGFVEGAVGSASVKIAGAGVSLPYTEAEIATLVALAAGKTEQQTKQQLMRSDLKGNKDLLNAVFNQGLLGKLEEGGQLVKGPDGKFI